MISVRTRGTRAVAGALVLVCLTAIALLGAPSPLPPPPRTEGPRTVAPMDEVRALWVLRSSIASPGSIATLVRSAAHHGFNTLIVQVRGRGDAYYTGGSEPRAAELARQAVAFDPLAEVLRAAHAEGLRVHAWVNVNLVSSAMELPRAREHLVYRHPEWLMIPRDLAPELARMEPSSRAYVERLARWTRSQAAEVEGLYASPIVPAAVDHLDAVVRHIVRRYAIDGVHFDYARYPSGRFDYSRIALREFRAAVRPALASSVRRELDAREAKNPLAYADVLVEQWRTFRVRRMTSLMKRLATTVRTERPAAIVTVAARPELPDAYNHRFQDWADWIGRGIVDAVCPMAYTTEPERFAHQVAAARDAAGGRAVWAGIGAYRLTPAQTIDHIQTARRLGATGVVLFSYDSLSDPRQTPLDYLAVVGRAAFARSASAEGSR